VRPWVSGAKGVPNVGAVPAQPFGERSLRGRDQHAAQ
jgi:hypothetical protein